MTGVCSGPQHKHVNSTNSPGVFNQSNQEDGPVLPESKAFRDSYTNCKTLLVRADVHFMNSPVLNPGHRPRCSTSCRAKFQAARTKPSCIFRLNNMAAGGEESELKSSTPTRSSGKRKASAVKKWRYQKRRRKCEGKK